MSTEKPSVAIVGAGIAGLAAAGRLLDEGLRVTVLEARHRIGGRIDTRHDFAPSPIELGAEFVHGRHPALVKCIRDAGLGLDERPFEPIMLADGSAVAQPQSWEKVFDELANPDAPDLPIAVRVGELLRSGEWSEAEARRLRRYVEGYMAADVDRVSARALSEETRAGQALGDDGNASVREGYDALVRHLARRLEGPDATLRLGAPVRRIAWRPQSAVLETADGSTIAAARAVVTIPLSLLQLPGDDTSGIRFEPDIGSIRTASRRLAMGNVVKLFLRLEVPLSEIPGIDATLAARLARPRFLQTPAGHIPTWWRIGDDRAPILVGWSGGASADRLAGRTAPEVIDLGIDTLSHALAVPAAAIASTVEAAAVADWSADPWSRGAYSWIPAGAVDAPAVLAAPLEDTLFFAGEATDTSGYRGTVHGALDTGLRAARQVIDSL